MGNKKIAILQSNYIPWKGYFDMIDSVDEFIFYDIVQYTKNDWRNRNKIKTPHGLMWLTIPVIMNNHISHSINSININNHLWIYKHWKSLYLNYKKAAYFIQYEEYFYNLFESCKNETLLCNINYKFIMAINKLLNINTKISYAENYNIIDGKTERLISLCKQASADEYVSGPAAKSYIDEKLFKDAGIKLTWFDYEGYKEYPQLYGNFEHNVSIIDVIFNTGEDAKYYFKKHKV